MRSCQQIISRCSADKCTVIVCRAADELKNEAQAHVLNHKNVVILYAMVFESQHYGVVLEFVPNGCLDDYIGSYKVLFNLSMLFLCENILIVHNM